MTEHGVASRRVCELPCSCTCRSTSWDGVPGKIALVGGLAFRGNRSCERGGKWMR